MWPVKAVLDAATLQKCGEDSISVERFSLTRLYLKTDLNYRSQTILLVFISEMILTVL